QIMSKYNAILIAIAGLPLFAATASAQVTNICCPMPPATRLEALETNSGVVIVKGVTLTGSLSASDGTVKVVSKLSTDATGRKESGIRIDISLSGLKDEKLVIDYDELDSMLRAIDSLTKLDWTVTPLSSFNAFYATKSGFRITASGLRGRGVIEYSI